LWIYGKYDLKKNYGDISLISSNFNLKDIKSLLGLNIPEINSSTYFRGKITGDIFHSPNYTLSFYFKDIKVNSFNVDRITIHLKGKDINNLDLSVSGKYGENILWGKGKFNFSGFRFDVRGRINWQDQIRISPYFSLNGDASSWNLEIYLKNSSLKYNSYSFNISDFNVKTGSDGNLDGYVFFVEGDRFMYISIGGSWEKWSLTFWGENIEVLGEKIKLIKLNLDNNLSGCFDAKIRDYFVKGNLDISLENRTIIIKDLYFNEYYLGDMRLALENNFIKVEGNIFQGSIKGYYELGKRGEINFSELKFSNLSLSGGVGIEKDYFVFVIPQLSANSLVFENIKGRVDFKEPNHIKNFSLEIPSYIKIYGDIFLENVSVNSLLHIGLGEKEIGLLNLIGNFSKFDFSGNIFGGSLKGYYEIDKNTAVFNVENLDLSNIDNNLDGRIEILSGAFKEGGLSFEGNIPKINLKGNSIDNVSFRGIYKENLNFSFNASYSVFDFSIRGAFDFKDENKFTLFIKPKNSVFSGSLVKVLTLSFSGDVDKEFKKIRLVLSKESNEFFKSGIMTINIPEGLIIGNALLKDNGEIGCNLSLYGDGTINLKKISLSVLEILNIPKFEGLIYGDLKLEKWNIIEANLRAEEVEIKNFPKKVGLSLNIKKLENKYLLDGNISKLSEKPAEFSGSSDLKAFDLQVKFLDLKFLEDLVSKDLIEEGNLGDGKAVLNINGDFNELTIYSDITWNNPLVFKYIKDRVYGGNFSLNYRNGELKLKDFEIRTFSNRMKIYGIIFPSFNIYGNFNNICLSIPGLANGYVDGDLQLIKEKDIYIARGIIKINNSHIYLLKNVKMNFKSTKMNFPLKLDVKIEIGDNVVFSEPNLIYISLLGSVSVKGDINTPILDGKIDFMNGNLNVLGNDFLVDSGYIKFPGLSLNENIWEIFASRIIQGYNVILKGISFMGNSSFVFSSEPPLSLREILFLLLGQKNIPIAREESWTLSTILESIPQSVEGVVSSAFSSYILSPLLGELEKALNVDRIKVDYILEGLIPKWKSVSFEKSLLSNLSLSIVYYWEGDKLWSTELTYRFNENLYFKIYTSPKTEFSFSFEYSTQF
jgi:translocation and assembly module TamB